MPQVMVVLALLSAAPKECKDDIGCFNALAAKCEPVVYRWHGTQKLTGISATGSTSYVVRGKQSGKCQVEYLDAFEGAEIDDKVLQELMPGATAAQLAEMKKKMLDDAKSRSKHYRCELETAKVVEWVGANLPNRVKIDEHHFDDCTPTDCGPKPALAKGCNITVCGKGGWHFVCGAKKTECVLSSDERLGEGIVAACGEGKDGKSAVQLTSEGK